MRSKQGMTGACTRAILMLVTLLSAGMAVPARAADGDLDLNFNFDGKVTTDFKGYQDEALAIVIDSAGRIVAVGSVFDGTQYDFGVARYNWDGRWTQASASMGW